uniref:hypothetical protein n=1 Tax=Azospirillum sp. TaxID=34012 RepID=UPI003D735D4D
PSRCARGPSATAALLCEIGISATMGPLSGVILGEAASDYTLLRVEDGALNVEGTAAAGATAGCSIGTRLYGGSLAATGTGTISLTGLVQGVPPTPSAWN